MRPWVHINCAMSADGKIALPSRVQTSISSKQDFQRVHQLRSDLDAVLVGIGTVLADDPSLKVKPEFVLSPKNPVRVLLDSGLRVQNTHRIVDGTAPTVIFCAKGAGGRGRFGDSVTVVECGDNRVDLPGALEILCRDHGIGTLLVEGGEEVIWSFLSQSLFDKLTIFVGSLVIGGTASPTPAGGPGAASLEEAVKLRLNGASMLENGVLLDYEPQ